jgi:hypothetical protein
MPFSSQGFGGRVQSGGSFRPLFADPHASRKTHAVCGRLRAAPVGVAALVVTAQLPWPPLDRGVYTGDRTVLAERGLLAGEAPLETGHSERSGVENVYWALAEP